MNILHIDVRKFLTIFLASGLASFLTLLIVQLLQRHVEKLILIAGKGAIIGIGMAIMFSLPKPRKNYPWM
jgi:hypothetical protein